MYKCHFKHFQFNDYQDNIMNHNYSSNESSDKVFISSHAYLRVENLYNRPQIM